MMFKKKKIFFVTGTRADYGKIKPIIQILEKTFNVYIFVTGMHLLSKYGSTHIIISKECKNSKIIKFRNQTGHQSQEISSKHPGAARDFFVKCFVLSPTQKSSVTTDRQ